MLTCNYSPAVAPVRSRAARAAGATVDMIGLALDTSRQNAYQGFGK